MFPIVNFNPGTGISKSLLEDLLGFLLLIAAEQQDNRKPRSLRQFLPECLDQAVGMMPLDRKSVV